MNPVSEATGPQLVYYIAHGTNKTVQSLGFQKQTTVQLQNDMVMVVILAFQSVKMKSELAMLTHII